MATDICIRDMSKSVFHEKKIVFIKNFLIFDIKSYEIIFKIICGDDL